jgi:hypothetical protein
VTPGNTAPVMSLTVRQSRRWVWADAGAAHSTAQPRIKPASTPISIHHALRSVCQKRIRSHAMTGTITPSVPLRHSTVANAVTDR